MHTVEQFDLAQLPEPAQDELYDFYLFLKQRYLKQPVEGVGESALLSEQSLAEGWGNREEDEAWQSFQ
jgi:hypothetical protein